MIEKNKQKCLVNQKQTKIAYLNLPCLPTFGIRLISLASNEELLGIFLEPEWSRSNSIGSKDDFDEGEDLAMGFFSLGGTELVALTLLEDFFEKYLIVD